MFELYHADDDTPAHLFPLLREGKSGEKQYQSKHQGSNKI
jgi:hypothetical protein